MISTAAMKGPPMSFETPDTTQMNSYDRAAWAEIEKWRRSQLDAQVRQLMPAKVRELGRAAKDKLGELPAFSDFEALFADALGGMTEFGARAAIATVRDKAIVDAFRKAGHNVSEIEDIGELELRAIDKVKPNLALWYTGAGILEGAGSGFLVSGGQIVAARKAIHGAGAKAAPGIATVLGVMVGDAAAVLVGANRAVAHVAAYYGYDLDRPDERLYALGVLSVGTAAGAGKTAAYVELNKLVQMLARDATWAQLRQNVITGVVEKVFARLGYRLTQRKLGQAVPILGIGFGAVANAKVMTSVINNAEHLYRERFLRDRYGIVPKTDIDALSPGSGDEAGYDEDVIDIVDIVEEVEHGNGGTSADDHRADSPSER